MTPDMYVQFSTATDDGQCREPFAIRVKAVNWHGMTEGGMLWDVTHEDSTAERIHVACAKYGDFRLGDCPERIVGIRVLSWAYPVLSKEQFHDRVGKGKFLHPKRGHFVDEKDLPLEQNDGR